MTNQIKSNQRKLQISVKTFLFFFVFFLKLLEDMSIFCGATDIPVLDFWWRLPWVSEPGWIPRLRASSPTHNGCLKMLN